MRRRWRAARCSGSASPIRPRRTPDIQDEATKYNGATGSVYNGQVGNANKGTISVLYQSKTYAAGSHAADDTETQPPCNTPSLMFDVKATEANLPLLFDFRVSISYRRSARTRVCS